MAFQNEEQIAKYQNNKVVLEFNDHLYPAPVESAANLHAGFSKIYIVAIDTSNGKGKDAKVLDVNVDPIKMKRLHEKVNKIPEMWENVQSAGEDGGQENILGMGDHKSKTPSEVLLELGEKGIPVLEGLIPIFQKNAEKYKINKTKIEEITRAIEKFKNGKLKPKAQVITAPNKVLFYEKKILGNDNNKNEAGEYKVTTLSVEHNPKMNSCWTVYMENGWGEKETNKNGGYSIKKGTYKKEKDVKVFIDDEKFRDIIQRCDNYISYKETKFMFMLDEKMNEYRAEKRKKAAGQ